MASDQHVTAFFVLDCIYNPADRFIPSLCSIDHPLSTAHFNLLLVLFSRRFKTHPSYIPLTTEVFWLVYPIIDLFGSFLRTTSFNLYPYFSLQSIFSLLVISFLRMIQHAAIRQFYSFFAILQMEPAMSIHCDFSLAKARHFKIIIIIKLDGSS